MARRSRLSRFFGSILSPFRIFASAPARTLRSGDDVYRVNDVKHGGMGIVYICDLISGSDEPDEEGSTGPRKGRIALKTFPERVFFNSAANQAFRNELTLWTRLRGVPFVTPMFGQQMIEGKPHIVMMAVPPDEAGRVSLADHVAASPKGLEPERCLAIGLGIAIGMEGAVKIEPTVVHGDLKPSNILVFKGVPMIADFGLARVDALARGHGFSGTPEYLAPESWDQDSGRQNGPSASADIYAFGCTLMEALTGTTPFSGNLAVLEHRHRHDTPAPSPDRGRPSFADAMLQLALRCLAKRPCDRPGSFAVVRAYLEEIGNRFAPNVVTEIRNLAIVLPLPVLMQSPAENMRTMLSHGDHEGARQLLQALSDEALHGDDLIVAGTTMSLSGDDEAALRYFERFEIESDGLSAESRAHCANEKGLSQARLGRHDEAVATYTAGLQLPETRYEAGLLSNRAMSYLAKGEIEKADFSLTSLVQKKTSEANIWAQLAIVKIAAKKPDEALQAIGRAISLAPSVGKFRQIQGEIYQDFYGDIIAALASLEAAHNLGGVDREWVRRMVTCCVLSKRMGDVKGLLEAFEKQFGSDEANGLLQEALRDVRVLLDRADGKNGPSETDTTIAELRSSQTLNNEAAAGAGATQADNTSMPPDASTKDSVATSRETGGRTEDGVRLAETIAAGGSYVNIKYYQPEHMYSNDFYCLPLDPKFVDTFVRSIRTTADVSASTESVRGLAMRERKFAFCRCRSCSFAILTNRYPDESLLCRLCDQRLPINYVDEPGLRELADRVNEALRRSKDAAVGNGDIFFAGFWPVDDEQVSCIEDTMRQVGFARLEDAPGAVGLLQGSMLQRNLHWEGDPLIWSVAAMPGDSTNATPPLFENALRTIRRRSGTTRSLSLTAKPDIATMLTLNRSSLETSLIENMRQALQTSPTDSATARRLVETLAHLKRLAEAKDVLATARQASETPDSDPDLLVSVATLAHADGRFDEADRLFVQALELAPRDQLARLSRLLTLQEIGDEGRIQELMTEIASHGNPLTSIMPI